MSCIECSKYYRQTAEAYNNERLAFADPNVKLIMSRSGCPRIAYTPSVDALGCVIPRQETCTGTSTLSPSEPPMTCGRCPVGKQVRLDQVINRKMLKNNRIIDYYHNCSVYMEAIRCPHDPENVYRNPGTVCPMLESNYVKNEQQQQSLSEC